MLLSEIVGTIQEDEHSYVRFLPLFRWRNMGKMMQLSGIH